MAIASISGNENKINCNIDVQFIHFALFKKATPSQYCNNDYKHADVAGMANPIS